MDIDIQRHGRITEATVSWEPEPSLLPLKGHGTSRVSKADVYLAEIGENIAVGRAIQDLGRQVEAIGNAQCVTKAEYARVTHLIDRRAEARGVAEMIKRHGNG
jgi:hypothetical protein